MATVELRSLLAGGVFVLIGLTSLAGLAGLAGLNGARAQEEKREPVLSYVRGSKTEKAHVVFVPPDRDFKKARTFQLRTPRGLVSVRCDVPHTANPPLAWASEISYPLKESLFHFRGPTSLPVHLPYRFYHGYGGYMTWSGSTVHEVRVNGKPQPNEDKTHCAPIIITGARNTLSVIICNSGGD